MLNLERCSVTLSLLTSTAGHPGRAEAARPPQLGGEEEAGQQHDHERHDCSGDDCTEGE